MPWSSQRLSASCLVAVDVIFRVTIEYTGHPDTIQTDSVCAQTGDGVMLLLRITR